MNDIILAILLMLHVIFVNLALHEKRKEIERLKLLIDEDGKRI